jgi:hypothetical protein
MAFLAKASVSPQTYFTSIPGKLLSMLNIFPKPAVCEFSAPMIPILKEFSLLLEVKANCETKGMGTAKARADAEAPLPILFKKDRLDSIDT